MENKVSNLEDVTFNTYPVSKRIFDLVVAFSLLWILSPILLLAAIAIRLESPGQVYYKSVRVGRYGRRFNLYKFRTMASGSGADLKKEFPGLNMISVEPRVTTVGRIIHKTCIDQLPQLINVIKGDMSIVGNYPLPIYQAERIMNDENAKRFLAPAGIISLWQVEERGSGNPITAEERLMLDNVYADLFISGSYSIWYDLALIIRRIR